MYRFVALFVSLLALGFCPVAIAQPTLSTSVDLSPVGTVSQGLSIAISGDGTRATAVWREASSSGKLALKSSSATISGGVATWGPVSALSAAGTNVNDSMVQISLDGTEAVAVWVAEDPTLKVSVVESSPATIAGNVASWGGVTRLSNGSGPVEHPRLSLASDGTRAYAVWEQYPPTSSRSTCRAVVGRSAGISASAASWGSVQQISDKGSCTEDPEVGMSSSGGSVTVVWGKEASGGVRIIRTRTATVNGTTASWGGVTDLSAPGFQSKNSKIAVSADGSKATVVWARATIGSQGRAVAPVVVRSRSATINGSVANWGATTVLSSLTESSGTPLVGISGDGTAVTAAWIRKVGTTFSIESASASVVGNTALWGAATNISGGGKPVRTHSLSISPDGSKALSVWSRVGSSKLVVQGVSGVLNGTSQQWAAVFDISTPVQNSAGSNGALSADGSLALLGWNQDNGAGKYYMRASVAELIHPTPTPTPTPTPVPIITSTPTSTPTPVPTTTPVGDLSSAAPVPSSSSNDHYVVLRVRDYPTNFRRDYYGYLLRASDNKLVKMGKFKIRKHHGRLEFHDVPPGQYRTFTVVVRAKAPQIISSNQRTITVK
jgi:hypothetical protein